MPNQPKWREVKDSWFDLIESWLNKPENREIQAITGVHLLQHALNVTIDQSANLRVMETRVGIIMSRLGWPKRRQNTGKRYWQYVRPAPANSGE